MERNIFCCVLALLALVNVAAIAGEEPKAQPAQASEVKAGPVEAPKAKAQPEKERLHVQYFRVFYDPNVEADQLSGIEAICIHMLIYMRKYEDGMLEPKHEFKEYSNGARGVVWFEYKQTAVSRSE